MATDLAQLELSLLLEGVFQYCGYDFRSYAPASLKRRVLECVRAEKLRTISELQAKALHDADCLDRLLSALSIHVTAMFRDPSFYLALRRQVAPLLRTYPFVRIWVAGCASGEEAYSLAILLMEEGLHERCKIYATDMNPAVVKEAEAGIFRLPAMKDYTTNYVQAGGRQSFSEYYTAKYGNAILAAALRKIIHFAQHNLVTDGSFNEFQVILCRNVLIYFNQDLAARVVRLLNQSLAMFGFLCLGAKESLKLSPDEPCFEEWDPEHKIYRKTDQHCARCDTLPRRCELGT